MPLVVENIYSVLESRLSAVGGQTINGALVLEVVEPFSTGNVSPKLGQYAIVWGDEESVEENDLPGNPPAVGLRQIFNIDIETRDEESSTAWGLLTAQYKSVVVEALAVDDNWSTFGGYALTAKVLPAVRKDSGGVVVPVAIDYRTSEWDRTVQR